MTRQKRAPTRQAPHDPKPEEPDQGRFANIQYFAYSGIFVVFAMAASINGFGDSWHLPLKAGEEANFVARAALFVMFVLLTVRWVIATHNELDMWELWLKHPFQRQEVYGALFGLSVLLGLSLAFPHKILFVAALNTVSLLVNYWTQWLSNDHFSRALKKTRRLEPTPNAEKKRVLAAMETYWEKRPQLGRMATSMFVSSIAFSLALAGSVQQEPQRTRFYLAAYGVLIMEILGAEITVSWWRRERDRAMESALNAAE